ncbi:WcaF family extracellular polysaccharide biosynthesis acetyltransferase [Telluribacter sp.]|jgi:putative colanic acid biosynthesis acetyltransferase WcaF|uniref:WcaF family extracellular polysaccharide biosynthesis acetyltransferase n=1 Tax=Telluribacter sp. TaxID=1978767 RepID=UPI002E0F85B0|nr:WcaF family extracellular polysaccharide biosynthesis acetyltransferase [Telluribacter sp.]
MEKTFDRRTDLSKYDNSWYQPGSRSKRFLWFIFGRIFINTYLPVPIRIKVSLLKLFGARLGKNITIKPKVNIKYPWFLTVEDNAWIGENVWIDNLTNISIGKNVCLSQGVLLLTGNHDYSSTGFDLIVKPIVLEEGVWIGAKSIVGPGVTAHSHAVLAVNSVATKNLDAFGIYRGNPAEFVKTRVFKK